MAQRTDGKTRSFSAGENLSWYRLIDLDGSGDAVHAGASSRPIGSTEDSQNSGRPIAVLLRNAPGTRILTTSVSVSKLDPLYPAADGKVTNVASAVPSVGRALQAVGADEFVEVL